jgi:hypothetical protein
MSKSDFWGVSEGKQDSCPGRERPLGTEEGQAGCFLTEDDH